MDVGVSRFLEYNVVNRLLASRVRQIIQPGQYCTAGPGEVLQTLLGSCIAACLWDPVAKVSGINHFLLAAPRYPVNNSLITSDAGRYGMNAIELVINSMMKMGAVRTRLRAKIFGGASVLASSHGEFFKIHEVNQRFIREYMKTEKIPLDAEDLGGSLGRVIYFDTTTYEVILRYIDPIATTEIEAREENYWKTLQKKPPTENTFLF